MKSVVFKKHEFEISDYSIFKTFLAFRNYQESNAVTEFLNYFSSIIKNVSIDSLRGKIKPIVMEIIENEAENSSAFAAICHFQTIKNSTQRTEVMV